MSIAVASFQAASSSTPSMLMAPFVCGKSDMLAALLDGVDSTTARTSPADTQLNEERFIEVPDLDVVR
jgi:hypothetical protein